MPYPFTCPAPASYHIISLLGAADTDCDSSVASLGKTEVCLILLLGAADTDCDSSVALLGKTEVSEVCISAQQGAERGLSSLGPPSLCSLLGAADTECDSSLASLGKTAYASLIALDIQCISSLNVINFAFIRSVSHSHLPLASYLPLLVSFLDIL